MVAGFAASLVPSAVAGNVEAVGLLESAGRTLAEDILADRDQPPFDRATRDGFAVRAAELGTAETSFPLSLAGEVRAGSAWTGTVPERSALSIMTGAPLPQGLDAVLMVEHATHRDGTVQMATGRSLRAGENVVPAGSEARCGDVLVVRGTRIGAAEIAVAAACGHTRLRVFRRPRVAIIATGDELVEVNEIPGPQQIRNSNSYSIAALAVASGAEPLRLPIAADTRESLQDRILEARAGSSLLIFSGGVSMGEYDLVEDALLEQKAEFFFTGVRMQPGKPVVFGRLPERDGLPAVPFFGLPGNPVSTQVTFRCFAHGLLCALGGQASPSAWAPAWSMAHLAEPVLARPDITRLLPALVSGGSVRLVPWQGSGDLAANARANCYAELLPGRAYSPGDVVRLLPR